MRKTYPHDFDEYLQRIRQLEIFDIPLTLLMQRDATMDTFQKYYDLGFRQFIMNDDELAARIKDKHADVQLTLSVTRVLYKEDIMTLDLSMYDYIVLFFWFNRHINDLKELPTKYKYILMPNDDCHWNCPYCKAHWSISNREQEVEILKKCVKQFHTMKDRAWIEANDLYYFDPYVSYYKLVDRLNKTQAIIDFLSEYASREYYNPVHPEDWYNV